jgi:pilus assembly protein CpaD
MTARKDVLNMTRSRSIAALLLGMAVSACATTAPSGGVIPNRGLDSYNQPVVERTDYVFDVDADESGLGAAERARLSAWFQSLGLGYGDRVFVDEPYGPTTTRRDIARVAAEHGLLLSDGSPVTAGPRSAGARVIVSRSTAHVPNCPNWEGPGGPSSTSSNYGCATNSNLAAMIADPSDLVLGQAGSSSGDATSASKAIKVYRDTPPTGTKGLITDRTRGNNQ